jgi:hypothetical protein
MEHIERVAERIEAMLAYGYWPDAALAQYNEEHGWPIGIGRVCLAPDALDRAIDRAREHNAAAYAAAGREEPYPLWLGGPRQGQPVDASVGRLLAGEA